MVYREEICILVWVLGHTNFVLTDCLHFAEWLLIKRFWHDNTEVYRPFRVWFRGVATS